MLALCTSRQTGTASYKSKGKKQKSEPKILAKLNTQLKQNPRFGECHDALGYGTKRGVSA